MYVFKETRISDIIPAFNLSLINYKMMFLYESRIIKVILTQ